MKVLERVFLRVALALALFWLSEAASGGCARYGHACWGGHGKRSSLAAKALDIGKAVDVDLDGEDASAVGDVSEAAQDGDDSEAVPSQAEALVAARRRIPYPVSRFGVNSVGDLVPIPSEQALQDPGVAEEIDEEAHRARSLNRRRHKNRESGLQVLIIPDEDSQLPNFHVYKILGHSPQKRA